MTLSPLGHYISQLDSSDDLSRIVVSVNPVQEIAAITNLVCKQSDGGNALLFEKPVGSDFRVATNLFGSTARVCMALGIKALDELYVRMAALLASIPAQDVRTLDRQLAALPEFSRFAPAALTEPDSDLVMMVAPDLTRFPFLHSWADDGSAEGYPKYITLPQVFTADPDGGTQNCGVYRVQLRGPREVAIQWKAGSGAARHADLHHRRGQRMPVAIVLGGDPATLFSAMFPLPGNLDELTFAGFMRGAALATVLCQGVPLRIPTGAEVVIEGYVEPGETVVEGPFGNHSGYYASAAKAALMHVTAISHRLDAVIPATVVGPPPMEDCWMAQAWERVLLAFLRKSAPVISDIHFPFAWVFHQSAIISLENPKPGMVRNIAAQLWALPWFATARILLFVAAEAVPLTLSRAAWRTVNVADFTSDIIHNSDSGRVAIDATGSCQLRLEVKTSDECSALVAQRWKEYDLA